MDNFDLRKFLTEGKLYGEAAPTEEAMDKPSNIQKLMAAGYSKSNAEDFADEFEQGGSKVPQKVKDILTNKSVKSKMKMSELKAKIRTEILAELQEGDMGFDMSAGAETQADVDFYEGLEEATKDGDGEVPTKDKDTNIDIIDKEKVDINIKKKPRMSMKADNNFLDQLEDLKDEADAIGDNKLERQIDNTITYFTRQHIAKDTNESLSLEENDMDLVRDLEAELKEGDKEYYDAAERDDAAHIAALEKDMKDDKRSSMNESLKNKTLKNKTTMKQSLEILRMKKLAGLITEGEYSKALLSEAKNPAKLKMMKNQLEMMLSELDNYLYSNTVDVEEGMMPRIEALIRDINTLMGDRTGLRENLDQELEAKIKSKIENLPTEMIDGVLRVDFDDIGNLWMDTFEETFGREFDDVRGSDEDYNNFDKIQLISRNLLSNGGKIEVEYDR
jgi:hypothetical protein